MHKCYTVETIAVLGAGSWGTALAEILARIGHRINIWDRNTTILDQIRQSRKNQYYHPRHSLSDNIHPHNKTEEAILEARFIILAIPSYSIRDCLKQLTTCLSSDSILVCAAKGIEMDTLQTISSVVLEVLGEKILKNSYSVLSGPSFAHEVIQNLPTAVTVASINPETAKEVQQVCHTDTFQIFTSDDVIGVELAGALKNVIAIAAGAVDGFGFGANSRAALITRGLHEMARIGKAKGANALTFSGLAGLGDLILTCTGDLSRNRRFGLKLAQGKSLREALKEVGQVVEGIRTAKAAYELAISEKLTVPILEEIYLTLHEGKSPQLAIKDLLSRAPEDERG